MITMENEELVPIEVFCSTCQVETTLIDTLEERGLVEVTVRQERRYIAFAQLERVEKMVRLHEDLGINVEGIEAIENLLERMERLQAEMTRLRNRLRRYGDTD
ncbi:MAG: MerR family transcriptional regulator [Flavobacteriales bacterium]|jgi:DNA-binding transcriptional MerR regulator|nr:MerR family transcriptional regulator [Flavobacteriales bacterium]MBK6891962.1 MerR family transcriptional regulator [Flavobacteriales bacterium]MBK7246100.1 MerR family transcriptional regulator [Flavobacteriales bacterium]MBK7288359.1 MerR family transcriptional regulator [Flavobacteriales bacterium]MBK9060130.1 MerR family transcriptional regulator [Flavobacteriales bacterium]